MHILLKCLWFLTFRCVARYPQRMNENCSQIWYLQTKTYNLPANLSKISYHNSKHFSFTFWWYSATRQNVGNKNFHKICFILRAFAGLCYPSYIQDSCLEPQSLVRDWNTSRRAFARKRLNSLRSVTAVTSLWTTIVMESVCFNLYEGFLSPLIDAKVMDIREWKCNGKLKLDSPLWPSCLSPTAHVVHNETQSSGKCTKFHACYWNDLFSKTFH